MGQTDIAVLASGIQKSFKDLNVLKHVDFSIEKGQIFALLGPNGSGKTTTIRILTTLLGFDAGTASINGIDVALQPARVREEISLTGQFTAVDDVLTGRENLRMIGKLCHLPGVNRIADDMLKRFGLLDAADRKVATYSGGMRRRLDLAMSLIGSPSIIFLDEPTAGLDPQSRILMWEFIKNLSGAGTTVFLTTQYLEEADQLADRIAILNEGTIVAEGTPSELKKLLPHGHMELRFHDREQTQSALVLLEEYQANLNAENQTLTIMTDGSAKETADVLNRLENAQIPVAEFTQKQPTLEDVFLSIIGEKQKREDSQWNSSQI